MYTLNQFIAYCNSLAKAHEQIMSFGVGEPWEIGSSKIYHKPSSGTWVYETTPVQYPLMWIVPFAPFNTLDKEATTKYSILFLDVENPDKSNEVEILSDQQQIAFDILSQFTDPRNDDNFIWDKKATLTSVQEKFDDLTAGYKVDVTIRVYFAEDRCAVPSLIVPDGGTDYPAPPGFATNSDRSFTIYVEPGSSNILKNVNITDGNGLVHSIPGMTDFVTPACSGGVGGWTTVQNSDGSYTVTWSSGAILTLPNVHIKKSDATNIATIASVKDYIVSDSVISNSDVSFTHNVKATDAYVLPDINVKINSISQGNFPSAKDLDISYSCPPSGGGALLGYPQRTNTTGNQGTNSSNILIASQFTCFSSGTISKIASLMASNSGNAKFAIYSDNSNLPGSLLGQTASSGFSTGVSNFNLISSVTLTFGTKYWIVGITDTDFQMIFCQNDDNCILAYKSASFSTAFQNPFGSPDGTLNFRSAFAGMV